MPGSVQSARPLAEIIRELKDRHESAANFRLIFDRYYGQVFRYFQRKGVAPEDCRDLAQETFLAAYTGLPTLEHEEHFEGWLFGIARNTFRNELDRKLAHKRASVHVIPIKSKEPAADSLAGEIEDRSPATDVMKGILDRERFERLTAAFREMPRQMRRCLELRVVEDSSYQDIATIMGISINTVKVHLHKAKKELQQKLSPYFARLEV
jgi:RNA polymerase sigma-70 factor (ECF subfamily)